jgi:RND family efflux transporter MFP subunit
MATSVTRFAVLSAPWLVACDVPTSSASELPPKLTATPTATEVAKIHDVPTAIPLTGTLRAARESELAANVSGKVLHLGVERGSRVRKGDVLARIDARDAALDLASAETVIEAARTRSEKAKLDCTRAEILFAARAISEAEVQATRASCKDASIGERAAAVRRSAASKSLGDTLIRAPFDGVVAERFVNAGEYVRPDSRVVALVELDALRLELAVPEHALAASKPGARVTFRVPAYASAEFTGTVRFASAAVRPATRDLLVEAEVSNSDGRLRPGMFATARIVVGNTSLPAVPRAAVRRDSQLGTDRVFVVSNDVVEERLVELGPNLGGLVAVRSGLRAGERFVSAPAPTLADGQRVR